MKLVAFKVRQDDVGLRVGRVWRQLWQGLMLAEVGRALRGEGLP